MLIIPVLLNKPSYAGALFKRALKKRSSRTNAYSNLFIQQGF